MFSFKFICVVELLLKMHLWKRLFQMTILKHQKVSSGSTDADCTNVQMSLAVLTSTSAEAELNIPAIRWYIHDARSLRNFQLRLRNAVTSKKTKLWSASHFECTLKTVSGPPAPTSPRRHHHHHHPSSSLSWTLDAAAYESRYSWIISHSHPIC